MSPSRRPGNAPCEWRRDYDIAPGARPCRTPCRGQSRSMQNTQRVLLAKPRTAPMARRRDGDIAPYRQAARGVRTATGHGRDVRLCARRGCGDTMPRTAVASRHGQWRGGASRETRRPSIALYRNGTGPRGAVRAGAMGGERRVGAPFEISIMGISRGTANSRTGNASRRAARGP